MKILIYKRTHRGDPDERGIFGVNDCMGRVRNWEYDAVIGIGGKSPWKDDKDIKYKVNWVGIAPKKVQSHWARGYCIVFSHFALFEDKGKNIKTNYPKLFKYMYDNGKRLEMSFPVNVLREVEQILELALDSPPSRDYEIAELADSKTEENKYTTKCIGCYSKKNKNLILDVNEKC